ncbi:MAG: hypothetical protein AB7F19_02000 [Candidatus Babeliales bacterium]
MKFSRVAVCAVFFLIFLGLGNCYVYAMDSVGLQSSLLPGQQVSAAALLQDDVEELSEVADSLSQGLAISVVRPTENEQEVSFYQAVLTGNDKRVVDCLQGGASLQERDASGKTVFHHLAAADTQAKSTLFVLLCTPRGQVIETVRKISLPGKTYSLFMKWHVAGLVRVLLMQDNEGQIPLDCVKEDSLEWQKYFQANPALITSLLGKTIILRYINAYSPKKE